MSDRPLINSVMDRKYTGLRGHFN